MKIVKSIILSILVLSLTACSINTEDPIKDFTDSITETVSNTGFLKGANDVFTYVQDTKGTFQELMNISGQWTEVFNAATNGEITNEELASKVKNEILPSNEELMTQIENLVPPTDATAIITDQLTNAVSTQQEALLDVVNGIQKGDYSVLNTADQMMSKVQGFEGEFTKMIQNIITEYGF